MLQVGYLAKEGPIYVLYAYQKSEQMGGKEPSSLTRAYARLGRYLAVGGSGAALG